MDKMMDHNGNEWYYIDEYWVFSTIYNNYWKEVNVK